MSEEKTVTVTTLEKIPEKSIGETILDGLTKVYTFITSRRIQFFALVSGLMIVAGVLGLPTEQGAAITEQLNATVDKGVELLIVTREFTTEVIALIGLLVIAYRTMTGLNERPITLDDHKIMSVTTKEVSPKEPSSHTPI